MRVAQVTALVVALFSLFSALRAAEKPALKVGQAWSIDAGRFGKDATLIVCKIEEVEKIGRVVHVAIKDIELKTPHGTQTLLPHLPFAEKTIFENVGDLKAASIALPDFSPGYEQWKQAKGGAFTITPREAMEFVERTLNQSR